LKELNNTQQQKKLKILLIGDTCTDEYQYGLVERISPEAPVPVFVPTHTVTKPGMASNVFENLNNLECEIEYYFGEQSVKTRLIDVKTNQQILRIDKDVLSVPFDPSSIQTKEYDGIVISDYNKGFVSEDTITEIEKRFSCPIFIDTKKTDLKKIKKSIVKINEKEYNLVKQLNDNCIVTLGEQGAMHLYNGSKKMYRAKKIDVTDVCGAGDTFLAFLAYTYMKTKDMNKAINFAMKASSVTIQHVGVYAPTLEEVCD
jgi:bifunctional ADP-heptose synthase (sugar kinase/adenylyltransferase)